MPYLGLSPFLPDNRGSVVINRKCVNALSRAIPISTDQKNASAFKAECVNALSRAIPISTPLCEENRKKEMDVCQCPISGYPHFYDKRNF